MIDASQDINESNLKIKLPGLLHKEVVELKLLGRGFCNNAYFVKTSDGAEYVVKVEREDKEFQPQNDLVVEARAIQELNTLHLSVPIPHIVFVSKNPKMFGYQYIEGELLRNVWDSLSDDERIYICRKLGHFHAEIGKKFTEKMIEVSGIQVNKYTDLHPEVLRDYNKILASTDVPDSYKILAKKAKLIFDNTTHETIFQFIHNDAHHENVLIRNNEISGIIDFGESEYGEIAKEFSRYIRDFPDYFSYIVSAYEDASGNKLSYKRLITNAFLNGLIDIVEDYRKAGEYKIKAENSITVYEKLIDDLD
jgi:aminoglycoside phosphotransferase (APT) family kinase protein